MEEVKLRGCIDWDRVVDHRLLDLTPSRFSVAETPKVFVRTRALAILERQEARSVSGVLMGRRKENEWILISDIQISGQQPSPDSDQNSVVVGFTGFDAEKRAEEEFLQKRCSSGLVVLVRREQGLLFRFLRLKHRPCTIHGDCLREVVSPQEHREELRSAIVHAREQEMKAHQAGYRTYEMGQHWVDGTYGFLIATVMKELGYLYHDFGADFRLLEQVTRIAPSKRHESRYVNSDTRQSLHDVIALRRWGRLEGHQLIRIFEVPYFPAAVRAGFDLSWPVNRMVLFICRNRGSLKQQERHDQERHFGLLKAGSHPYQRALEHWIKQRRQGVTTVGQFRDHWGELSSVCWWGVSWCDDTAQGLLVSVSRLSEAIKKGVLPKKTRRVGWRLFG